MPITHARKKFDAVAAEFAADITNDLRRLFCGDVAGSEIFHYGFVAAAAESYEIATQSDVFGSESDPHARRFQGRTPRMISCRIVTHDAHVADITAGREALGTDIG